MGGPGSGLRGAPTKIKLAKGERRPSRVNYEEPALPAPGSVEPPAGLDGAGLAVWRRLAQPLTDAGVLTDADLESLEDYCRALTELRLYERRARKARPELAIAKGYAGIVIKLRAQANQLRTQLGLTPSSRGGVKAIKGGRKDEDEERYFGVIRGGKK